MNECLEAMEVWERLCVKMTGEMMESDNWSGTFTGQKNYMFFGCGDGCCDNWWETKDEFIKDHINDKFRVVD